MKKNALTILLIFLVIPLTAQESVEIPFTGLSGLNQFNSQALNNLDTPELDAGRTDFTPDIVGQKNVGLAFLMSLAVPGAGEFYMGKKGQSLLFLSSEILIWTGLYVNNEYASHLKDEYYTYAAQHANVNSEDKDRQYWIDIGKYNSIYEFNEQRRRDRFFDAIYDENEVNYWLWDSENNRLRYDGKRIRAGEISSQDVYFYATILLNHVISGINSMRLARQHNRRIMQESNWSIRFHSQNYFDSKVYGLNFSTHF